jgi:hypothetical protein
MKKTTKLLDPSNYFSKIIENTFSKVFLLFDKYIN